MKFSWLILAAALAVTGCVRTHMTDLALPPPGARTKQGGAENVGLKVSVADKRIDRTNIGYGSSYASPETKFMVIPNQPIDGRIAATIEAEFLARGYRLDEGPAFLLVDIERADSRAIWYLARTAVTGDAKLKATVLSAKGDILYSKAYQAKEDATNSVFIGNYDEGKEQLEKILAKTIRDMADDDRLIQALFAANRR
ncbi:exported hypothetical protein [Magnetospirillum sp. LM-5]|uniref:YajG family lipoprotein n=1 Tax=Magnetospirillum sp. LM-5 TaxID=2681466 RepID=UPI00137DB33C|nr:YajG family lipoprotein [Magnetospirillum sp. LM-5]CAA7619422.1 exported hypothetical protein [Magnetospirillum sp. LM-5]